MEQQQQRNFRFQTIKQLHGFTLTCDGEDFLYFSEKNNFVMMTCETNAKVMCDHNTVLIADHMSRTCDVLQYLFVVHG